MRNPAAGRVHWLSGGDSSEALVCVQYLRKSRAAMARGCRAMQRVPDQTGPAISLPCNAGLRWYYHPLNIFYYLIPYLFIISSQKSAANFPVSSPSRRLLPTLPLRDPTFLWPHSCWSTSAYFLSFSLSLFHHYHLTRHRP